MTHMVGSVTRYLRIIDRLLFSLKVSGSPSTAHFPLIIKMAHTKLINLNIMQIKSIPLITQNYISPLNTCISLQLSCECDTIVLRHY